jgi:probable F420-dependent oxidoreductase
VHVGVQLPQNEIGVDPGEIRELVQGIRDLGFHHVSVLDHVLGADRATYGDRDFLPYDATSVIHEPLVLFGYIAACAPELHLLTSILVLPQRQTALVAKQVAEIDVLARGQLRLGVAVGWNDVEYEALGMDFTTRGRRLEEQVGLLRRLWTEPVVTFEGAFDRMHAVAINPPPVQRPIPIWFGGGIERARWRAAVLGDGLVARWPLPERPLDSDWPAHLEQMRAWRREAGLDGEVGLEARVFADLAGSSPEAWRRTAEEWRELGASHLAIRTIRLGLSSVEAHLERLALARDALGEMMAP